MAALLAGVAAVLCAAVAPASPAEPEPSTAEAEATLPHPAPGATPQHEQDQQTSDAPAPAPEWDGVATYESQPDPAPSENAAPSTPGEDAAPSPEEPAGDGGEPWPQEPPADGDASPERGAGAHNRSSVLQAIVQVQVGCRRYCYGTSQEQVAGQTAETTQSALALGLWDETGGAVATNEATTLQFVWQTQLGCVAFCFETSLSQSASQVSVVDQTALAVAVAAALAANTAQSIQYVWQRQEGCEHECHGVSESQSAEQRATTRQSASAGPEAAPWDPDQWDADQALPWLTALAESLGAVVQTVFQFQEAACLEHCGAERLTQEATQRAETVQRSEAADAPPPPRTADPPGPGAGAPAPAADGERPPDLATPAEADGAEAPAPAAGDRPGGPAALTLGARSRDGRGSAELSPPAPRAGAPAASGRHGDEPVTGAPRGGAEGPPARPLQALAAALAGDRGGSLERSAVPPAGDDGRDGGRDGAPATAPQPAAGTPAAASPAPAPGAPPIVWGIALLAAVALLPVVAAVRSRRRGTDRPRRGKRASLVSHLGKW